MRTSIYRRATVEELTTVALAAYDAAPEHVRAEGRAWYPEAARFVRKLARETGLTHRQCGALVALYSVNTSWKGNLTFATRVARTRHPYGLAGPQAGARALFDGARPSSVLGDGDKVPMFYRAVLGDRSAVVVDRWMARLFAGTDRVPKGRDYWHLAAAIHAAAELRAEHPADMQAILWIAVRGKGN